MDYTSKDFYVPTINFFESGNILTGSCNGMNYKVTPKSNDEGKLLLVQLWYGPMNLEHSPRRACSRWKAGCVSSMKST